MKRRWLKITGWFIAAYLASYIVLSAAGYYYSMGHGLTTEYGYRWSPRFFTSTEKFEWHYSALFFYLPLWKLDHLYLHPDVYNGPPPEPNIPLNQLLKKQN